MKILSGSFILLVTALMVTVAFGCGEGFEGDTGSQSAELTKGECNAIVGTALRAAQRCARGECGLDECTDVGGAFGAFFGNEDCATAFFAGDLNGLPGNAAVHPNTGDGKHMGDVVCSSVVQCGLCPAAPPTVCVDACEEAAQ